MAWRGAKGRAIKVEGEQVASPAPTLEIDFSELEKGGRTQLGGHHHATFQSLQIAPAPS